MVSPPSQSNSQEICKDKSRSSQSFKHGYANMPSSNESHEFKPLIMQTKTAIEEMSKKISDSKSTVYEEYVP